MKRFDFSVIRNLRMKRGMTAEELAKKANLTRATVAKIEGGSGNPTMGTIEAIAQVFQLLPSELVRIAEVARFEIAETQTFKTKHLSGIHIWFPNFEMYHIRATAGSTKESDPRCHENTAEVCMVLSGKIRVNVGSQSHELGPGMALRFKALHDHHFDIMEDAEFLLIHHSLV